MSEWYQQYLKSDHWRQRRMAKLEHEGFRCERCGQEARLAIGGDRVGLQVHHRNYDNMWHERFSDLEVLCGVCHRVEHGLCEDTPEERARERAAVEEIVSDRWFFIPYDEIEGEIASWDRLAEAAGL